MNQQLQAVRSLMSVKGMGGLCDAEKRCPLHYAAVYGNSEMIRACTETKGPSYLNARDVYQKTPLIRAAETGNFEVVQILVELGADVSAADQEGFTILDYAVLNQNKKLEDWIKENTSLKNTTVLKSPIPNVFGLIKSP